MGRPTLTHRSLELWLLLYIRSRESHLFREDLPETAPAEPAGPTTKFRVD